MLFSVLGVYLKPVLPDENILSWLISPFRFSSIFIQTSLFCTSRSFRSLVTSNLFLFLNSTHFYFTTCKWNIESKFTQTQPLCNDGFSFIWRVVCNAWGFKLFFFLKLVVERHCNASVRPTFQRMLPTHSPGAQSLVKPCLWKSLLNFIDVSFVANLSKYRSHHSSSYTVYTKKLCTHKDQTWDYCLFVIWGCSVFSALNAIRPLIQSIRASIYREAE